MTAVGGGPSLVVPTPELLGRAEAIARHHLKTLPVHRAVIRVPEALLIGDEELPRPLLDVGCGDGHFAATCLHTTLDAGVDLSRPKLAEARATGVYRLVCAADAVHLPYAGGAFASVVSNCALEHIPDFDGAIAEICRVLRPGGKLVMTVPSEHFTEYLFWARAMRALGLTSLGAAYERWFMGISDCYHAHPRDEWIRRLEHAGFQVAKWSSYLGPDAMGFFDLSHYYGAPTLLSKRLTGRWILWPGKRDIFPWERWLERRLASFAQQIAVPGGAYYFFTAVKA